MEKKGIQQVSAAQEWRERMKQARKSLPDGVGQQDVLKKTVELNSSLDTLTNSTRWRNAWLSKIADPEITQAVEKAAEFFADREQTTAKRLKRQKIKTIPK